MSKSMSLWYPRYVGDYQRKTSHLSLLEHGAYTVLLDHYYATGKPLPTNVDVLYRICRAFEHSEQDAVKSVLLSFFVKSDDGYHNDKVDKELSKRCSISEKRTNAVNTRYGKKATNVTVLKDTSTSTSTLREKSLSETSSETIAVFKTVSSSSRTPSIH